MYMCDDWLLINVAQCTIFFFFELSDTETLQQNDVVTTIPPTLIERKDTLNGKVARTAIRGDEWPPKQGEKYIW
jgi:hypothetical protein